MHWTPIFIIRMIYERFIANQSLLAINGLLFATLDPLMTPMTQYLFNFRNQSMICFEALGKECQLILEANHSRSDHWPTLRVNGNALTQTFIDFIAVYSKTDSIKPIVSQWFDSKREPKIDSNENIRHLRNWLRKRGQNYWIIFGRINRNTNAKENQTIRECLELK